MPENLKKTLHLTDVNYRGVNIKNPPPLRFFAAKIFKRSFIFHKSGQMFQALFYYSQNLAKCLGPIYTIFGPFFLAFPP